MSKQNNENENTSLKLLLDYSWQKYNSQSQSFESLDSKSATMSSFVGLLFSIITGFIYYLLAEYKFLTKIENELILVIFILITMLLILSITRALFLALSSLGIRKIVEPAKISDAKNYFIKKEFTINRFERKFLIYLIKSLENSEASFRLTNSSKSSQIKSLASWLKIGIILTIIDVGYVITIILIQGK